MLKDNILGRLIPGGILPTDHVHVETNDNTCSRCRQSVPEDQVPILMWNETGERLWIYCETCLAGGNGRPANVEPN